MHHHHLFQIGLFIQVLLNPEQQGGAPVVQSRNIIVVFDRIGEAIDAVLLDSGHQSLQELGLARVCERGQDRFVPGDRLLTVQVVNA